MDAVAVWILSLLTQEYGSKLERTVASYPLWFFVIDEQEKIGSRIVRKKCEPQAPIKTLGGSHPLLHQGF